jgi:minor curlin subunit
MSAFRRMLARLALIGALGASAVQAQSSYPALFSGYTKSAWAAPSVEITQNGRGNSADSGQNGVDSAIRILQNGAFNTGQTKQDGVNNNATIRQINRPDDATVAQTGVNNSASIVQVGRGNFAGVVQTGGKSGGVIQTRAGSHTVPAVLGEIDP